MNTYQIAVIVGSLRKDSFNQKLAQAGTQGFRQPAKAGALDSRRRGNDDLSQYPHHVLRQRQRTGQPR